MNCLLDTNVVSELFKKAPHEGVIRWMNAADQDSLFLSVLTIGEIRKGIERMVHGDRKARLVTFLEKDVQVQFEGRILPIDLSIAETWGTLEAHAGRPLPPVDALLAATAIVHNLSLVTRNIKHFSFAQLRLLDPWS